MVRSHVGNNVGGRSGRRVLYITMVTLVIAIVVVKTDTKVGVWVEGGGERSGVDPEAGPVGTQQPNNGSIIGSCRNQ